MFKDIVTAVLISDRVYVHGSFLHTELCSKATKPQSVFFTQAPAQGWTNDHPINTSSINEVKVVELWPSTVLILPSSCKPRKNVSERPHKDLFHRVSYCWQNIQMWGTYRRKFKGPVLQGCSHYLSCFLITCSSFFMFEFQLNNMYHPTNYLSPKLEVNDLFFHYMPYSTISSRTHEFLPWLSLRPAYPSPRFCSLLPQFKPSPPASLMLFLQWPHHSPIRRILPMQSCSCCPLSINTF